MIHDLHLALHLTGGAEATEVRASGLSLLSSHLDLANARVEFSNGAVALRHRQPGLPRADPPTPAVPAERLSLARPGQRRRRVHAGPRRLAAGTGQALTDVVERIELQAPEADALQLELLSFVHAVQGQREVVVSGDEGRAALALALRVADAVRQSPLAVSAS